MAAALPAIYLCNTMDTVSGGVDAGIERDALTKRYEKWVYGYPPPSGFHAVSFRNACICSIARVLGMLKIP